MAKVERVDFLKTELADKPGSLLKIMTDLKAKNIGVSGLWAFGTGGGRTTLFAVAKNHQKLSSAWKASGLAAEEGTGFFVTGADRTGALVKTLDTLAEAGVNIHAIDAIAVGGRFGSFIWVDPSDVERAAKALGAK